MGLGSRPTPLYMRQSRFTPPPRKALRPASAGLGPSQAMLSKSDFRQNPYTTTQQTEMSPVLSNEQMAGISITSNALSSSYKGRSQNSDVFFAKPGPNTRRGKPEKLW